MIAVLRPQRDLPMKLPSLLTGLALALVGICAAADGVKLGNITIAHPIAHSIDNADVTIDTSHPDVALLVHPAEAPVDETLSSSVFRSMCPVTGQPDYADIFIHYRGPRIGHAALLQYSVSYRHHAAFHEACVERIFVDIRARCRPQSLSVYARFLRRGGIDINPFRSNFEEAPPANVRTPRQ